jgi:hypothetical protein
MAHSFGEASDMSFFPAYLERIGLRRECTDPAAELRRDPCIAPRFGESLMPTQKHKRPGLRPAVEALLASCFPLLRRGGRLPLARVVETATGGLLKPAVIQALEGRGDLVFEPRADGAYFSNSGPHMKIALRRFDLIVPTRISGRAFGVLGVPGLPGGIEFRFESSETLRASKFLVSVNLERLEVTSERILVNVQGGMFDQRIELV